ncbi:uncharacterized protein LOC117169394 isoform X4 [Belonocnema kinseyi]|uniref:uncharacterized protein LOC117169394 isoform X4 n=1 Tax=Belonocnema kinseyi TaxID=2817044 RepID=UPI00143D975A|nr:uncharacterized protein LOC117169394 isoform X4 [Belonocnema kinseyi]
MDLVQNSIQRESADNTSDERTGKMNLVQKWIHDTSMGASPASANILEQISTDIPIKICKAETGGCHDSIISDTTAKGDIKDPYEFRDDESLYSLSKNDKNHCKDQLIHQHLSLLAQQNRPMLLSLLLPLVQTQQHHLRQ